MTERQIIIAVGIGGAIAALCGIVAEILSGRLDIPNTGISIAQNTGFYYSDCKTTLEHLDESCDLQHAAKIVYDPVTGEEFAVLFYYPASPDIKPLIVRLSSGK